MTFIKVETARCAVRHLWSLSGVMLSRLFRLGRFFNRLAVGFDPFRMKHARFVDAFVSVRAEEIALRLQEICRQSRLAITIKVSERRGKRGNGDAMLNGCRDRDPPIALRFLNDPREIAIKQKIVQRGIAMVRFNDPV